jgi:hypothetical protein
VTNFYTEMTCKPGKAECCRYLCADGDGWVCAKLTSIGSIIDERVAAGTMNATGDNCEGIDPATVAWMH